MCHHQIVISVFNIKRVPKLQYWRSCSTHKTFPLQCYLLKVLHSLTDGLERYIYIYICNITSGAIQYGVPTEVFLRPRVTARWEDTPKSTSFTWASSVSNMLCPFTSLCIQWLLWRYIRACQNNTQLKCRKYQIYTHFFCCLMF